MSKLIELKQNRDLLQPDFPGYKLSLQNIPKTTINLTSKLKIAEPNNEQYTYKHAKLFSLHNHILATEIDTFEGIETIYYISTDRYIYATKSDILGIEEICTNFQLPIFTTYYNCSMVFPDKNLAIVSNGAGDIYFLDRNGSNNEWKCIFAETHEFKSVILDAKTSGNILHLILFDIVQNVENNEPKHQSVIRWSQYENINGNWSIKSCEKMQSFSELHFVLLSNDLHLYLMSDKGGFLKEMSDLIDNNAKRDVFFTWSQTDQDLCIFIKAKDVKITHNEISVTNNNETLLKAVLFDEIDAEKTAISSNTLSDEISQVILHKKNASEWPSLIKNQPNIGECYATSTIARQVLEKYLEFTNAINSDEPVPSKQSMLMDQVEECDFQSSKWALIERITPDNDKKITHRVILTQEIIFVDRNVYDSDVEMFAIQQNEDVCIYKPVTSVNNEEKPEMRSNDWNLEHVGTLLALGYIRASKQRRKFTTCAPDFSYFVIAEGGRHVFVYRQNVDVTSGELRHRSSGRRVKQLAQQQVIELDADENIWGVRATNCNLFVLTEAKVYVFKMN